MFSDMCTWSLRYHSLIFTLHELQRCGWCYIVDVFFMRFIPHLTRNTCKLPDAFGNRKNPLQHLFDIIGKSSNGEGDRFCRVRGSIRQREGISILWNRDPLAPVRLGKMWSQRAGLEGDSQASRGREEGKGIVVLQFLPNSCISHEILSKIWLFLSFIMKMHIAICNQNMKGVTVRDSSLAFFVAPSHSFAPSAAPEIGGSALNIFRCKYHPEMTQRNTAYYNSGKKVYPLCGL